MAPLVRSLGLAAKDHRRQEYQARRAELMLLRAGWRELRRLEDDAIVPPRVFAQLDAEYRATGQQIDAAIDSLYQNVATGILVMSNQKQSKLDLERLKPYFDTVELVDTITTASSDKVVRRLEIYKATNYKGRPPRAGSAAAR